jgi:selenide, water dikinase
MLLSSSRQMTTEENDIGKSTLFIIIVLKLIIKGFNDLAEEAQTEVTGGQTVQNEWLLLGGVAICKIFI